MGIPGEIDMDYDDEFDDQYDDSSYYSAKSENISKEGGLKRAFDPLDITVPRSEFFFLSDDVQDDLDERDKPLMRCLSCGQRFKGVIYDSCPKCFCVNTEEIVI